MYRGSSWTFKLGSKTIEQPVSVAFLLLALIQWEIPLFLPAVAFLMLHECELHFGHGYHGILNPYQLEWTRQHWARLYGMTANSERDTCPIAAGIETHRSYLQSDVALERWPAFQALVAAATVASLKWDASRHVEVFHLSRVLLLHIHQLLHRLAHALCPHLVQSHCCVTMTDVLS